MLDIITEKLNTTLSELEYMFTIMAYFSIM